MAFLVTFLPVSPPQGHQVHAEMPCSDDDYFGRALKSCAILEEVEGSKFLFSGFGSPDWMMNIGYDMSTFVESLPELVDGIEHSRDVDVDLYSQGVECDLHFRPVGEEVDIDCTSWGGRHLDFRTEALGRSDLLRMLRRLQYDVARGLALIDPRLDQITPFADWHSRPGGMPD